MSDDTLLAQKFAASLPHLNEKQRRLILAAEARSLGHAGISRVARASGISRTTIQKALREVNRPDRPPDRMRRARGGRNKTRARDPSLLADLEALVTPDTRGDPISPLRWTCKSTRQLAEALNQHGHHLSEQIVRDLLHEAG